jgi:DNA-binding transcriptional ArsR family regulator
MTSLLSFPILYHSTSDGVVLQNEKIIAQLKVLDNEVKLKILALLADTGAKSITDISRILNLNFSTAHKYLEQLERVGFVRSQQETGNRLKRMFYIQNFIINLTPRNISTIIRGEKVDLGDEQYGKFHIITHSGKLERFDKYKFAKLYLDAGVPKNTIEIVFDSIKNQIYEGITWSELENLFIETLKQRVDLIQDVVNRIKDAKRHENTFANILSLNMPEAIKLHREGDIFIQNLSDPRILNFIHDIRALSIHGTNGKVPQNLDELFELLFCILRKKELQGAKHSFESFNYFIAPLAKDLSPTVLREKLKYFFDKVTDIVSNVYVSLEFGMPEYLESVSPTFFKTESSYIAYSDTAELILNESMKLLKNHKDIKTIVKINTNQVPSEVFTSMYLANMKLANCPLNTSFVGTVAFGSDWRGWLTTLRVGEIQNISVNLPALASQSSTPEAFSEKLESYLDKLISCHLSIAEKVYAHSVRYLNATFPSAERGTWNYINISNFQYTVSLYGLDLLSSFGYSEQFIVEQTRKLYSKIKEATEKYNIRLSLRQEQHDVIIDHFSVMNNKKYSLPSLKSDLSVVELCQKYLPGGYVYNTSSFDPELLKKHKVVKIKN